MKISTKMMKGIVVLIGVSFFLAPMTVFAANKVVVIPLFGPDAKPLKNIVTVAKANGNFTDPVAAVNSITDASAGNPYLVVIGPGVYTVTSPLQLKAYVDIAGCGENVTKITGAISTGSSNVSSAIVSGANNSALSFLTVENTGGGSYSIALYNGTASPRVANITATASGGSLNLGVYNYSSSSPVMTQVTATASGGTINYGVFNYSSSSPVMTQVTATASGGMESNYGVYNTNSSNPKIRHSAMEGGTYGLYASVASTSTVSQSTIIGGVGGVGANTCVACDNGSGTALNASCQ